MQPRFDLLATAAATDRGLAAMAGRSNSPRQTCRWATMTFEITRTSNTVGGADGGGMQISTMIPGMSKGYE